MRQCKSSHEAMEWCMTQMSDMCLNRLIAPAEMQPNYLFGKASQKGTLGFQMFAVFADLKQHKATHRLTHSSNFDSWIFLVNLATYKLSYFSCLPCQG